MILGLPLLREDHQFHLAEVHVSAGVRDRVSVCVSSACVRVFVGVRVALCYSGGWERVCIQLALWSHKAPFMSTE